MKIKLIFLLILVTISGCSISKSNKRITTEDYFKIIVVQNNKRIKEKNGVIHLKKEPFQFKITLYNHHGIDVSASWGKDFYDFPEDKNIYYCDDDYAEACLMIGGKTIAQSTYNTAKKLYVDDGDGHMHWFYKKELDWHRFDQGVKVKNGIVNATMTIENIFDLDLRDSETAPTSQYDYSIDKIDKDIYLVCSASSDVPRGEQSQELKRKKVILRFN